MSKIATKPFVVPRITASGLPIDSLVINLRNLEDQAMRVCATVNRYFPYMETEGEVLYKEEVLLSPHRGTTHLVYGFHASDNLRVVVEGDVKDPEGAGTGVEVWLVIGNNGVPFEPSSLYRHSDFIELYD